VVCHAMVHEASEPLTFGLERELTYAGHLTPAAQLVPLVKRTFASADETHVRVWGPAGDIAKFPFPSNRRSMVSALTFCPNFSTIVTGEVDMTLKCYSLSLDLVECFPLEQERAELRGDGRGERKAKGKSGKVTTLAYLPAAGSFILAGSESGCELWQLTKSRERRINTSRLRGLEYHLQLNLIKQVTTEPVHRIVVAAEGRVVIAELKTVLVLDHELNLMASCNQPFVCSAYLGTVSSSQAIRWKAQLLTGTSGGAVQLWNIQAFESQLGDPSGDGLFTRLEHTFNGHTRSVEMVCFYDRDEHDVQQRFAVSCALDLRLQVWSMENFVCVYTLYFGLADSKAHIFPISLHHFALSYTIGGGSNGDGAAGASVAMMRFNAHYASPFATTCGTVVQIAQAPAFQIQDALGRQPAKQVPPKQGGSPPLSSAAVLVSEDMAIRVFSAKSRALLSTLPPPPNAKVQVLEVFLCPEWQLLILWLSSEEVAIFYVPSAPLEKSKAEEQPIPRTQAATPLLLRRFSIVEVRTQMMDKDLSKESFRCVSLYHGPLPKGDTLLHTVKVAQQVLEEDSSPASPRRQIPKQTPPTGRDWYLLVGTQMGTLQAFKIADLLMQLPVWGRLAPHLPKKEHTRRSPARAKTMRASVLKGAVKEADGRLAEIEKEHEAAMEASRTPGQRPFPPSGPQLKLYSRWRRHDYAIDFVKSMADLILTIDAKNGLKVCQAEDSRILFRLLLPEFSCLTPYIVLAEPAPEDHRSAEGDAQAQVESDAEVPPPTPQLLGVTLGNSRGSLEMVELPWTSPDVEVFSSQASHGGPVLQVDYLLPIEIFVSVGEDDTVRFWSSALQLLREVFFPQPCSTVAFLRLPDMDTSAGHGDVLVGFAAHVERVPMEVWARGVKHEKLGGTLPLDSTMRSSQGSKATGSSAFTKSSTQEMDELLLQELYRFSPEDEDVLGGERPPSSEIVKLVDEELPKRRRSRTVMDFRGAPVVPLGVLGSLAADMVGVEERLSHRPEALEHVPHEHSQVLDQGDLRAITRYHAGYYDWTVNPSAMVDAPRGCAIRGVTGDGNVAIVTSVGIGHLRGEGHAFQPAPQEAPSEELFAQTSREEEPEAGELLDEAPLALPGPSSPRPQTGASVATSVAATSRRPDSREPRLESRTSARTGEAQARGALEECIEETDDEGMVKDEEEEEDTWRNLHIARGVPHRTDMPKPQTQNIANTDADAAKMLREHGKLIDAPEGLETNFLSRLTNKKTEWIYCGIDNVQVARRTARKVVRQTIDEGEGLKLWTATGRLRTGHRPPPQQALPKCYVPLPPEHLWERPPMTRSEVTERRIIEAARCPQSRNWMEELALESAEFHEARGPLITSARVRARGAQSSRSASSVTVTSAAETDTSSSVGRPGRPRLPRKVSFNLPQVPKTHR